MKRVTSSLLTICIICSFILTACGSNAATVDVQPAVSSTSTAEKPPEQTAALAATATDPAPTPTVTPTPAPPLPCNIAFDSDRDGNQEIYRMNPDGTDQVNLSQNPSDDTDPVWSPDGSQIAFVSNRKSETGGGQFIYVMLADGSEVSQVSQQADSHFPDWSPDGGQITFSSGGDIFLINLSENSEVNLTNSPEADEQPKFSLDGKRIAWLSGPEDSRQIYIMDLDGGSIQQVTDGGTVHGLEWTVDGRIFANWDNPDGTCFNCLVNTDGTEVTDAGGKGEIQKYLPFWTLDGQRVEMVSITGPNGDEEIFLVGEIFPDLFLNLTNTPANDRNPDIAAKCGPASGSDVEQPANQPESQQPESAAGFVIGYEDADNNLNPFMQEDLDRACSELGVECVRGEDIASLAAQNIDAIISVSSRWHVMGSSPQLRDAVEQGIPVFVLNAETTEPGAFNLSMENETIATTLSWMFKQMGEAGEFVYYNYGDSAYHQQIIDSAIKDYPGIEAIKKAADFNGNNFTQQDITEMIGENPGLGAIWTNEYHMDLFWGVLSSESSQLPLINCIPRLDVLTAWKEKVDSGSPFRCLAYIKPGGIAYEGIYAAYYYLSGHQFKPEALVGTGGNTLKYIIPEITNENVSEWLNKAGSFRMGMGEVLELPPMSPEEILSTWFVE